LAEAHSNPDRVGPNTLSQSLEPGPGDAFYMPPGHDAWIAGDKRRVLIDFTGVAKYAKPA
jgi:hypothetical protein